MPHLGLAIPDACVLQKALAVKGSCHPRVDSCTDDGIALSFGPAAALRCRRQGSWASLLRRKQALALLLGLASWAGRPRLCAASARPPASARLAHAPSAIVFLHGSGDSGKGFQRYLQAVDGGVLLDTLAAAGVVMRFPDSGIRPYRLMGGMPLSIWYDRTGLPPSSPEDAQSVESSVKYLAGILADLKAEGIPPERIVVGGFSMGGGIALQLALRHPEDLGGAFVLSSYMCDDAAAYRIVKDSKRTSWPSILMAHGEADDFIRFEWGRATAQRLEDLGVPVHFQPLRGVRHELALGEIGILSEWLQGILGPQGEGGSGSKEATGEL